MLILTAALLLAAADVSVEVAVLKPLKLSKRGELRGLLAVKIKNLGPEPVRLAHRDVHGFLFTPTKGGTPSVLFHSCDCAFELGQERQPAARTFSLEPQQERVLRFDDFTCDGGPHRAPPPGSYQLTFQLSPAADPPVKPGGGQLDFKECERLLVTRPAEPHRSKPIEVKLQR